MPDKPPKEPGIRAHAIIAHYHPKHGPSAPALAAIQRELAQCIEKREMLMAHTPLELSDEISWTSGKIAGLNYAVDMLVDGVPQ